MLKVYQRSQKQKNKKYKGIWDFVGQGGFFEMERKCNCVVICTEESLKEVDQQLFVLFGVPKTKAGARLGDS